MYVACEADGEILVLYNFFGLGDFREPSLRGEMLPKII